MIRRTHRALAALSALWFAMLVMAGPMLHECAMHDGAVTSTAEASGHVSHGGAHDQAPVEDECEHCTCLGDCAGTAMTPAIAAVNRQTPTIVERGTLAPAAALEPSTGSPDVRLPFSVGPPLLA